MIAFSAKAHFEAAKALMLRCSSVIDTGAPQETLNEMNRSLLAFAKENEMLQN